MNEKGQTSNKSLLRLVNAFKYSLEGLASSWKEEQAFRQEVIAAVILTPLAILIPIELSIRLILLLSIFGVLIVELLNSAVEAVTDLVTEDHHRLAKKAKDCGSAAVFVSLIVCVAMWGFALWRWYQLSH